MANEQAWQPINTAPMDGSRVLLWNGETHIIGFYGASINHYRWRESTWQVIVPDPTHWAPLLDPPGDVGAR